MDTSERAAKIRSEMKSLASEDWTLLISCHIAQLLVDERERIAREIEALPRTHSVVDGYRPSVLVVDVLRVVRGEASPEPTREQLEVCPGVLYDGKHFLAGTHAVKGTLKVWSTFEDAVKAAWAERGRG